MKMAFRWQSILWPKTERGKSALFWATVFAGIWLLLQGLSGFCLGFNPVRVPPAAWAMALLGIFARELLRALLSALPKGSSFWRGLAHCLRARTGGVPADRRHSQPSSAPVERISPHPFPLCPADGLGHTRRISAGASLRRCSSGNGALDPRLPGTEPAQWGRCWSWS